MLPVAEKPVTWLSASEIYRATPLFKKKERHETLLGGYFLMTMFGGLACMFEILRVYASTSEALKGDLFGSCVK